MENLEKLLQEVGFLTTETKVILALMELGSAKVKEIAIKAGVDRINTYGILEKLAKQGLVSQSEMAGVKIYISEPPEKFLSLVQARQRKILDLEERFQKSLPELQTLYNLSPQKPKVRFYEGKEGVWQAFQDRLRHKSELKENLVYGSSEKLYQIYSEKMKRFIEERVRLGIRSKIIVDRARFGLEEAKRAKEELREIKLFPKGLKFQTTMIIYGDRVLIINFDDLTAVTVEDRRFVTSQRLIFNLLWKFLKRKEE